MNHKCAFLHISDPKQHCKLLNSLVLPILSYASEFKFGLLATLTKGRASQSARLRTGNSDYVHNAVCSAKDVYTQV